MQIERSSPLQQFYQKVVVENKCLEKMKRSWQKVTTNKEDTI